jgi:hypothetical protein
MRRIYVPLDDEDLDRLIALAERERRRPSYQAAVILSAVLRETTEPPDPAETQLGALTNAPRWRPHSSPETTT